MNIINLEYDNEIVDNFKVDGQTLITNRFGNAVNVGIVTSGVRDGIWLSFNRNGRLSSIARYESGYLCDDIIPVRFLNNTEETTISENYKLINVRDHWHVRRIIKNIERPTSYEIFDLNNNLVEKGFYSDGCLVFRFKFYDGSIVDHEINGATFYIHPDSTDKQKMKLFSDVIKRTCIEKG
jgi:antitoxin component YwqK of YwqJK toxin-antitoxin module